MSLNVGDYNQLCGLNRLIQEDCCISSLDGYARIDMQYYISSLPAISKIRQCIRGYRKIKIGIIGILNITFRKDDYRARKDYSATNLNASRKFVLVNVA